MKTSLTNGLQTATGIGPVNSPGADVSGLFGVDFTLTLRVTKLSSTGINAGARVVIEESVDGFVTALPVVVVHISGPQTPGQDLKFSWRSYQLSESLIGVQNSRLRGNVVSLRAGSSLTFEGWIDS